MIKKLSKHGNSLAIFIDKPILELLNMNENTRINITTDGSNIIIKPIRSPGAQSLVDENPELENVFEELNQTIDTFLKKQSNLH